MRRALKWIVGIFLVLIALPILAVVVVLIGANTAPGRHLIEAETPSLTGGMVRLQGIGGRFPDALTVAHIEVADAKGPYVTIQDLVLDWSPLRLLGRVAEVDALTAAKVELSRLPVASPAPAKPSAPSSPFTLPVQVRLGRLHVDQAVIGAPVAGTAATLSLDGSGALQTLTEGTVNLVAQRLDGGGRYVVVGTVTADHLQAKVNVDEPVKGLISEIAHLPDLGAIAVQASVDGPRDAVGTQVAVSAGSLRAAASGNVDLVHEAAALAVQASAPAMAPAPGVSWGSVQVDAHVQGPFTRPDATGTVRIADLVASGARVGALAADLNGDSGHVQLHATVSGLAIPGPKPELLAAAPVVLDATARLDTPDRPVTFALHHPLIALEGSGTAGTSQQGQAHLVLPDLAPLAAAGGVALQGSTDLVLKGGMADGVITAAVTGKLAVTGGMAPVPALIGPDGQIDVAATMKGQDITLSKLAVNGKALSVSAQGGLLNQVLALDWHVGLSDLAAVQPGVAGKVDATGHVAGHTDDLGLTTDIGADVAAKGFASGHVMTHIEATGLPAAPHATVTASGTLLEAPISLALTADRTNGTVHATIDHADWKSLKAAGALSLAQGATLPVGTMKLTMGRLADLSPLVGKPLAGQAALTLNADEKAAHLTAALTAIGIPGTAEIGKADLKANVTDPTGHPSLDATLAADGISASSAKGASVRLTAKGPETALGLTVTANAPSLAGGPVRLATAATINATARNVALTRLEAGWKDQTLRLLAPARIGFASGVSVDRLRIGFRQAELSLAGTAGSKLDLTASLRNLPADIGAIVDPSYAADGTISAQARLTGTTARPSGTVRVTADRVRLRQGPGRALPAANAAVNVQLAGTSARVDANLTAGPSHLAANGTVPLATAGAINLTSNGRVDLAMLDPLLAAQGRRARGQVTLNATAAGTIAAPRVNGTLVLANGDVSDFSVGAHVSDLAATLQADGETIRLTQFTGKAGPGSLGGSGSIGLTGQMPVNLHFTASNARPLSSDLMTALIDADLTVQGEVKGNLQAGGTLHVRRADIRIPDKLPASVAVLPVRDPNAPPPPPPPPPSNSIIALNLTLSAPEQVFVRGRGLDAELGGTIHVHGTVAKPQPDGGLQLRSGTFSIIGSTLTFTSGSVTFSGAGLADPSINFVATSSTASVVATLTISGTASNPKITLSSVPDMPQDEILAQLLFNTSSSKLSPLQLAQIAAALASLSGATSGVGDPLDSLRTGLGLDRLSVGSNAAGSPTLEAGRYVARGVYVGATQAASGSGTQAVVQVDIAKGLKLQTTAGSGTANATGAASSSDAASIGLTYQFEY